MVSCKQVPRASEARTSRGRLRKGRARCERSSIGGAGAETQPSSWGGILTGSGLVGQSDGALQKGSDAACSTGQQWEVWGAASVAHAMGEMVALLAGRLVRALGGERVWHWGGLGEGQLEALTVMNAPWPVQQLRHGRDGIKRDASQCPSQRPQSPSAAQRLVAGPDIARAAPSLKRSEGGARRFDRWCARGAIARYRQCVRSQSPGTRVTP